MGKKTIVLGASASPYRYSYMAANRLKTNGHNTVLVGKKKEEFDGEVILDDWPSDERDIDTITMYLSPRNQKEYYDKIRGSGAKRLIFNPGSENEELASEAREAGIEVIEACTLVMLSTAHY